MRGFLIVCALLSISGCYPQLETGPDISPSRRVQVIEVCKVPASSPTTLIGEIEPCQENLLYFEVSGTVAEVFVQAGDTVEVGAPIARLVLDDFELALALAQEELESARARLNLMEAGTRDEDLEIARAANEQSRVRTAYWTNELGRQEELYKSNSTSVNELEQTQREQAIAVQAERLSKAELERAIAGPRKEEVVAAAAEVRAREHALGLARRQLEKATLVAPFDGRIEQRLLDVGAYVNVFPTGGVPVVHLVDLQQVDAVIAVPETLVARFVEHASLTIFSSADRRIQIEGCIQSVGQMADRASGTYAVRARFPNPGRRLTGGMVIETKINAMEARSAIFVPLTAVFHGYGQPPQVLVLSEADNRVAARDVELGPTFGNQIEIVSGLSDGALLIVRGQDRVVAGDLVEFERLPSGSRARLEKPLP